MAVEVRYDLTDDHVETLAALYRERNSGAVLVAE